MLWCDASVNLIYIYIYIYYIYIYITYILHYIYIHYIYIYIYMYTNIVPHLAQSHYVWYYVYTSSASCLTQERDCTTRSDFNMHLIRCGMVLLLLFIFLYVCVCISLKVANIRMWVIVCKRCCNHKKKNRNHYNIKIKVVLYWRG